MALDFSFKLNKIWTSGCTKKKSTLQRLIFTDGIMYNCKTEIFRTEKINEVFSWITKLISITALNAKGQTDCKVSLSSKVEPTGLEPVSKHIRRKLSTCLFLHCFSKKYRSKTNQYFP